MSDYFRQHATISNSFQTGKSWAILSPIEVQLKRKIEDIGTQLKDWDVRINRGILTGFNEAFIIDEETKDRLLKESPKNAEIICPILFGDSIKRFYVKWDSKYLINAHNGVKGKGIPKINVEEDYPIIFQHLSKYQQQLEKRSDKGDHWSNLRNCAYLDEFWRPKIIYPEITKFLNFYYDKSGSFLVNNKCFILAGESLEFLTCFLNSKVFRFAFMSNFPRLPGDTFELRKIFF